MSQSFQYKPESHPEPHNYKHDHLPGALHISPNFKSIKTSQNKESFTLTIRLEFPYNPSNPQSTTLNLKNVLATRVQARLWPLRVQQLPLLQAQPREAKRPQVLSFMAFEANDQRFCVWEPTVLGEVQLADDVSTIIWTRLDR